jgi:high-affinity K+ transport system ATPase subunit B
VVALIVLFVTLTPTVIAAPPSAIGIAAWVG